MRKIRKRYSIGVSLLTVVAIAGIWTRVMFVRDLNAARARIASSAIADTACGPVEYASIGTGFPLLVVHGAGGGFDQGLDFGADFAARGFRVIAMSRFGYLRTPLPNDASAEAQADAHACLLDALHVERAVIVGASAGSPSALQFALRHADRCAGAVLVVPALYVPRAGGDPPLKTPRGTEFLFDTALRSDFFFWAGPKLANDFFMRAILATPPELLGSASVEEQARMRMMFDHILPVSERRNGLTNDSLVTRNLRRYPLELIHVPTLAISAADDLYGTYESARYTAEHIAGARFIGFETGGHLLVGHQPELVEEITKFSRSAMGPARN